MKTFEFTEQEAELLRKEQYKYLINDNIDHFLLLVQQIVSERITPEPGESGQSAEDVESIFYKLCDIARRDGASIEYLTKPNAIEAMRLHASQVCADKDLEIEALNWAARMNRSDFLKAQSELDKANESLTVMLRENAELEKEVKRFNTMRHDSAFVNNVCLSYRHDFGLVAPKERKLIEFECLEWMRAILNNIEFKPK